MFDVVVMLVGIKVKGHRVMIRGGYGCRRRTMVVVAVVVVVVVVVVKWMRRAPLLGRIHGGGAAGGRKLTVVLPEGMGPVRSHGGGYTEPCCWGH